MTEEIIFPDDERAATYRTNIEGWVSRAGKFYGKNENFARYEGSTHNRCDICMAPAKQPYLLCPMCRDQKQDDKYDKMEVVEWDGKTPVYSLSYDEYFYDMDDIENFIENIGDDGGVIEIKDLQLVLCEETKMTLIDSNYWNDCFHDDWDGRLPAEVLLAMLDLNLKLHEAHTDTWIPTNKAVRI